MNIFIIPSWYPNRCSPYEGIFVRDQAQAIAAKCPSMRVFVSTWGHGESEGYLKARYPLTWGVALRWRLAQRPNQIQHREEVWEVFNPCLKWSNKLPLGGIGRLVAVNRRNLEFVQRKFGKIDLIHAHVSYPAGYIALLLAREFAIPYVVTEHMSPFPFPVHIEEDGRLRHEIIEAFTNAAVSIAVSPSLATRISAFGLPRPEVIPNVVHEGQFSPGHPAGKKFVFLTLCGLSCQKGIDDLLQAIAHWNPLPTEIEFQIGGDGPMREEYKLMAEQLGVANRVNWLGHVSRGQVPALFQNCHAYVMSSRHETFGVVYAEAIATGKPIIATRCGGPEFIVNENNGRLVDVGDVIGLSRTMERMVGEWKSYDPMIIRKDFESRFSRGVVVEQLKSLYESIV